jgi:hypothetical protein
MTYNSTSMHASMGSGLNQCGVGEAGMALVRLSFEPVSTLIVFNSPLSLPPVTTSVDGGLGGEDPAGRSTSQSTLDNSAQAIRQSFNVPLILPILHVLPQLFLNTLNSFLRITLGFPLPPFHPAHSFGPGPTAPPS